MIGPILNVFHHRSHSGDVVFQNYKKSNLSYKQRLDMVGLGPHLTHKTTENFIQTVIDNNSTNGSADEISNVAKNTIVKVLYRIWVCSLPELTALLSLPEWIFITECPSTWYLVLSILPRLQSWLHHLPHPPLVTHNETVHAGDLMSL